GAEGLSAAGVGVGGGAEWCSCCARAQRPINQPVVIRTDGNAFMSEPRVTGFRSADAAGPAGGDEAQIRRTDPGGEVRGLRPKPDRRLRIAAAGSGDQGVGPRAAKTGEASGVIEALSAAVTRRTSPLR